MANIQESSFAMDAATGTSFGFASTAVALPGVLAGDTVLRVCNLGPCPIMVKLGTTGAVSVTSSTGLAIMPGNTVYLTLGANTFIAGVAAGGPGNASSVNLATGN
jgi:hypothetical protein